MFDPYSLALPGVATLSPYEPGKPEDELKRELNLSQIVKLASNENPMGCSPKALARLSQPVNLARYPDGSAYELKQKLANKLSVSSEQITIGNGSNDVLELLVRAFVSSDDKVVISQHAFAVYFLTSKAVNAKIERVAARNWGHDLTAMAQQAQNAKMVFVANPNNPTGSYADAKSIQNFLQQLPDTTIAIIDEAYFEYVDVEDHCSALEWLQDFPNLVITRTFSKAYGLAGLRIGYCVSSSSIADLLNRVRQPFNANTQAQHAAIEALADDDFVNKSVILNRQQKHVLYKAFEKLGLNYLQSQGNFVCVEVTNELQVYQKMLEQGVIVRPVGNYQMPGWLRFTVGLEHENQCAIDALAKSV